MGGAGLGWEGKAPATGMVITVRGTQHLEQLGAGMDNDTARVDPTPFECVPHWILMDTSLSANALRIWLVLRKHRNYTTGDAWPGRKRLAVLCGVSLSTVDRELPKLAAAGAITITKRKNPSGGDESNLYHVHWERGGVTEKQGGRQNGRKGGVTKTHELRPIDNKEVPDWINAMDDGPEHTAAMLAFQKGKYE